ncbi:MAG: hypothetical protein K8R92_04070 [Planctomycetes bacterium]|nr:hypothetical protein [Planctomycetota bacterium]
MAKQMITERAFDFRGFQKLAGSGINVFVPTQLAHIYVKLDFQSKFESAQTAEDAKGFFRSVARATLATDLVAKGYGGEVLEVQGSMLHIGVPLPAATFDAQSLMGSLHAALGDLFSRVGSRVDGWRMAYDNGRTLVVASRGVHGDSSYVSLGKSANRPAKHIYAQLELPESERKLKRGCYAEWDSRTTAWKYGDLGLLPRMLKEAHRASSEAYRIEPRVSFIEAISTKRGVRADAAPIGPGAVNPNVPRTYFGWVMRADLDGFTARVEECFDDDARLTKLASDFLLLMEATASFTMAHKETLAQLPWAGDNFTVGAIYGSKDEYDRSAPRRLTELVLDFEKELATQAKAVGFGGWAYGVAGGEVHGNAGGNMYIATAEAGGRRFLLGAGEGFGRSAQAFGDVNPKAGMIVIYEPDWARLDEGYKKTFDKATTAHGTQSSLFRQARTAALQSERVRLATVGVPTIISIPGRSSVPVSTKPYFK